MGTERDERIRREASELWREVFGAAPPPTDGEDILRALTGQLPNVGYDRLTSPFLGPSMITRPKAARAKPGNRERA